jgi:hypothetical protein
VGEGTKRIQEQTMVDFDVGRDLFFGKTSFISLFRLDSEGFLVVPKKSRVAVIQNESFLKARFFIIKLFVDLNGFAYNN